MLKDEETVGLARKLFGGTQILNRRFFIWIKKLPKNLRKLKKIYEPTK